MILVTFFKIPYRDRLAKNVKSRCVQIIPRSTDEYFHRVLQGLDINLGFFTNRQFLIVGPFF